MNPIDNRFSLVGDIFNIKPVINAAVNKLDLFAKSSGVAPTTDHPIGVNIPGCQCLLGCSIRSR